MNRNRFLKDPDEVLDFEVSWVNWLADGDTIATSTWTVPAGITKDSDFKTTTTTTIWLSGGTSGSTYELDVQITTSAGRTAQRRVFVEMMEGR